MCERINTLQNDLFAMKQMTPYSAIDYLYHSVGYQDFLSEYATERGVSPKDWEEILDELKEDAAGYETVGEWFAHIEDYGRQLEERQKRAGGRPEPEEERHGVSLMTMHGSKGLEFYVVFIPDVN